jgi:hypothetical protein
VTLQDLGSIGEFVAAIATLVTLVYLALQIRHSTQEARAASRNAVSQSFVDLMTHISHDLETTKLTRRGFIDPESLDDDDTLRFDCIGMALFQNFEAAFAQRQRQVLTDDDWEKWVVIIKQYMAQPGVQQFWSRTAAAFNPAFRRYVEELGSKEVYSYTSGRQPAA